MSIQHLKNLRELAWIPTPLGDKFSLHFDDTKYLELVAEHIINQVANFTPLEPNEESEPHAYYAGYGDGYNAALKQITGALRERYLKTRS